MYFVIKKKYRKNLIDKAIKKAGSERKLGKTLGIAKSVIYYYKYKGRPINQEIFIKLMKFLNFTENDFSKFIKETLPNNWKQKIGGINCYNKKIKSGKFLDNLIEMNKGSKRWHKKLQKKDAEAYHRSQYEKFKKIYQYKFTTKKGEKVRNSLEKQVADFIFNFDKNYEYEPYVKGYFKSYFPDFKVGNLLIECTMWNGFDNAFKLLKKINDLSWKGYKTVLIIPKEKRKYYKILQDYIIELDELKQLIKPSTKPS